MSDGPEWFAHKRYGYGASFPITREGWALTLGLIVLVVLASFLIRFSWVAYFSVVAMLVITFSVICARTTQGGWRWRWGEDE